MQLTEIIEYWSYWDKVLPVSFPRKVKLPAKLDSKIVMVIQGVRRCGKSTLLTQLIERYRLDKNKCLFVNFEDPRLIEALNTKTLDEIVSFFTAKHSKQESLYYFFDEIQNVPHWEKWILSQLERSSKNYFIVTGSNANLLSRELGSSLTGRHFSLNLFPFSYEERVSQEADINVLDYISQGGFPAMISNTDSAQMLRQYFDDIITKDIISRLGISNPRALKQLIKILFESTGSESSFRKLAGATGLSADTVASYIQHAEDAYLILSCPYFSFSEKQRIRRNNKYYPVDSALRRAVATPTGSDLGKDFELIVFLAFKRLTNDVYYWKGTNEVDFVIHTRNGIWPVQVSLEEQKLRHAQALEEFYKEFPNANTEIFCNADNFSAVISDLEQVFAE